MSERERYLAEIRAAKAKDQMSDERYLDTKEALDDRREYTCVEEQSLKNVASLDPDCPAVHTRAPHLHYFQQWDYNDEEAYTENDKYDLRKIKIECPNCGREWCALMSSHTKELRNDLRWVGCDHREPYITYGTKCVRCNASFMFTTHTPQ